MNGDQLRCLFLGATVFPSARQLPAAWNLSESLLRSAWSTPDWLEHYSPAAILQLLNLRDPRMKEDPIARPKRHRHLPDGNPPFITADDQRAVGTNDLQRIVGCFRTQDQAAGGPGAIQAPSRSSRAVVRMSLTSSEASSAGITIGMLVCSWMRLIASTRRR